MSAESERYVSRGGLKLEAALREFGIDVQGRGCCDLGSHVGGFVDCLLQHGAASVHAVEPGYGVLDYKLRRDERVVVHERTNALDFFVDIVFDLVTIDVGWTPQRLILPVARRLLRVSTENAAEAIGAITLIKPHYEAPREWLSSGVLQEDRRAEVLATVRADVELAGFRVCGVCQSPIEGHAGNREELWWLKAD